MISDRTIVQVVDNDADIQEAVEAVLKYFNIFRHALYIHEIHKFLQVETTRQELLDTLNEMVREGRIFCDYGLYALTSSSQIYLKRIVGADVAAEKMKEASRSARMISRFPFVKGICVSGSLSKGYADENSDIDFFIITANQRLWICRTMLHLFKKLTFLINKQHSFCMNYFIDEGQLCLDEQNLFTATELATLIPMYNMDTYEMLMAQNIDWIKAEYFPNVCVLQEDLQKNNKLTLKRSAEWVFNSLRPQAVNKFLMNLTDTLWRYKWKRKNYPMEDYDLAMKTKWYVSKHHPLNYQKKVLERHMKDSYQSPAMDI
ncbi:MAG: nucleotidyltransferase domain-containing protein [Chitinophagaceae bacterium]|nr:nucleotidyltransferase domain-containing protein [Chitinophagaceae bacterium]MCB9044903.1 nucleotidyltransferase domain-containing protein [Chitinophagales bacterium]